MCGKTIKENKTSIAVWLTLAISVTTLITGWTLKNIDNNNKQDVDIAVLINQYKNINDKLDDISKKLDTHLNNTIVRR